MVRRVKAYLKSMKVPIKYKTCVLITMLTNERMLIILP